MPGQDYCAAHTRQALHDLARGNVLYFKADLPHTDKDFVQEVPTDVRLPKQTPPDDAALLWIPITRERLPARLLYADDCPAARRTAIRMCAQKCAWRLGLRLWIEPPRGHPPAAGWEARPVPPVCPTGQAKKLKCTKSERDAKSGKQGERRRAQNRPPPAQSSA